MVIKTDPKGYLVTFLNVWQHINKHFFPNVVPVTKSNWPPTRVGVNFTSVLLHWRSRYPEAVGV